MEELQISLTPARVEQRNFGLWLRTPQVGQVLNAVVADKLPSGEMVLKVGAERVTVSTDIPLQPGARLLLEVKQVQPQVTFRVLSAGGTPLRHHPRRWRTPSSCSGRQALRRCREMASHRFFHFCEP